LSDSQELLTGVILLIVSVGALIACYPRNGKTAWFVGVPFLDPTVSILVVGGMVIGVLLIVAYFTAIDNGTVSGMVKAS
jgi:uncharacterized membrane protein